ncbi:MAG: type II toxin-antitoxin system Phd/YefM family antitoxin [Clostridia bacterium]|nr:type II toxin-antitoxin system Phd/YefM family antitoxin [Clostridia bacterium]
MMISSTEFKTNLGKYLDLVTGEDIIITRNGRKIAKLVKEEDATVSDIRSLFGILANTEASRMSDSEVKEAIHAERSKRYDGSN